ncbi:MAG: hypothetical protein JWP12_162 [Bacteroidetes bacterium]|nr:hypothetical protein [Bacteroidota bacterium]
MYIKEAIEILKKYNSLKGQQIRRKSTGELITINVIIAAPTKLSSWTDNYRNWVDNNLSMVLANPNADFDIYFFDKPYSQMAFFILLEDFENNYSSVI